MDDRGRMSNHFRMPLHPAEKVLRIVEELRFFRDLRCTICVQTSRPDVPRTPSYILVSFCPSPSGVPTRRSWPTEVFLLGSYQ